MLHVILLHSSRILFSQPALILSSSANSLSCFLETFGACCCTVQYFFGKEHSIIAMTDLLC